MKIDYPEESRIPEMKALWKDAFGEDDDPEPFFKTAFYPLRSRCVILDGKLVSALYWLDVSCRGQKMAYIYAVATLSQYRRQGICRALLQDTHELLTSQGYAGAILVPAGPDLAKFYEQFGYRMATTIREFFCAPEPNAAIYHIVNAKEYAVRRKELLPEGAVIQEGENMAYLETQAEFYEGPGFLMAAVRKEDSLQGLEVLGNTHCASALLRAFGIGSGTFRTPGEGRDFAMFLPLTGGCEPPSYFAFAFE